MAKHTYTVTINRAPSAREPYHYTYSRIACVMTAASGAASVTFQTNPLYTAEDLVTFRVPLVKDAMRKMHLLHAMRWESRLRVNTVTVTIDGDSQIFDKSHPGFPFLHSMLMGSGRSLPPSWKTREFLEAVLARTKTDADSDHRFACLYSFLAAQGKQFAYEQFTCYWTAMNACYNHLARCFNAEAAKRGHKSLGDHNDGAFIGALLRITDMGTEKTSQKKVKAHKSEYGAMKSYLNAVEDLAALHTELYAHRTDKAYVPEGPLGDHLRTCIKRTGMSAYGFILLDYAYYIRCNYLHGSKPTILFAAANDPELAAFRTLNLFLREFLKEILPQMFREDWFTEEMYQAVLRGIK